MTQLNTQATTIWLAEGQSSQRDMLLSLQALKPQYLLNIIASHRAERPEILSCADKAYYEPDDKDNPNTRVDFVLHHAKAHQAKVLLTGRNSIDYEVKRIEYEQAGMRLLTGATDIATLATIDDKFVFMQHCQAHDIPVAQGWRFDNVDELYDLLTQYGHLPLCVKPITGIFAQGFWRLDTGLQDEAGWDSFEHLYLTDAKKIHVDAFIHAYSHSEMVQSRPIPMLLMPYLSGREYSIDVVCERGEVLAAITRYKEGSVQYIGYDEDVIAVVIPLIKAFGCDGIVSVQTKADSDNHHHVLEINSRPSGGIDYTAHSGINLTQLAFLYFADLIEKPCLSQLASQIQPCAVRPLMTSVKI